jgi:competence protein ComEC
MKKYKEEVRDFLHQYGKVFFIFLCLAVAMISCFVVVGATRGHYLKVSFLDIGQGDAIFIQTPSGHDIIIDGGPSDAVLEKLSDKMSYFDRTIDVMVATHPDADHVTGLIPILEKFSVENVITSSVQGDTGVFKEVENDIVEERAETHIANAGDVIDFHDGVTLTILHPFPGEHFKDTNEGSVTMLLRYGDETFLLDGDLPTTKESLLLTNNLSHNITVYKAGHHGSKYSSGEQLLTYIKPEYSVISAGKDNKYGHPNPEALERLKIYSKNILSTIESGTITFITDGKSMNVQTAK